MPQHLIAISLSHHTADVELRERMALSEDETRSVLQGLKEHVVQEALILSTCNRTELYALPSDEAVNADYLVEYLIKSKESLGLQPAELRRAFTKLTHCDAITHLFEVISGIDSQIIGDQQIFSQVKEAFRLSEEAGTNGGFMTKLAHTAFRVAKRVRTETTIGTGAATISYAAVEFTRKVYDDLRNRSALVIGAGETSELAAKHLSERGIGRLQVANRNVEKATEVLLRVREGLIGQDDRAISLDQLEDALSQADIVISSTGAPGFIVTRKLAEHALRNRDSQQPVIFLDIAVPRDIDPEVGKLSNVFLKDIDDLRSIVDQNLESRRAQIPQAKEILREELDNFLALQSKLEVGPTIKELRDKFEQVRQEELERQRGKFSPNEFALVDEMTRRIMNRLLHQPTVMLKEPRASLDDVLARVELLRSLFALDKSDASDDTDTF